VVVRSVTGSPKIQQLQKGWYNVKTVLPCFDETVQWTQCQHNDQVADILSKHGDTIVQYDAGYGEVSMSLAQKFSKVTAVVIPRQLNIVQANCENNAIRNCIPSSLPISDILDITSVDVVLITPWSGGREVAQVKKNKLRLCFNQVSNKPQRSIESMFHIARRNTRVLAFRLPVNYVLEYVMRKSSGWRLIDFFEFFPPFANILVVFKNNLYADYGEVD
jgi:hypothetical protein